MSALTAHRPTPGTIPTYNLSTCLNGCRYIASHRAPLVSLAVFLLATVEAWPVRPQISLEN